MIFIRIKTFILLSILFLFFLNSCGGSRTKQVSEELRQINLIDNKGKVYKSYYQKYSAEVGDWLKANCEKNAQNCNFTKNSENLINNISVKEDSENLISKTATSNEETQENSGDGSEEENESNEQENEGNLNEPENMQQPCNSDLCS